MKGPVQSVEATCFVHATEDLEKVAGAMGAALSYGGAPEREELEGHFGNRIILLRLHLTGKDAEKAVLTLASRMTRAHKAEAVSAGSGAIDEHSALFLRFDKQDLVKGSLTQGSGDSLRVKVKPRGFVKGRAGEFYSEMLGGA